MARRTDLGTLQIRNDVIGTIALLAAQEVRGVVDAWRGIFPANQIPGSGAVRVETREQEVRLWLNLVAEYGISLPELAAQVQDRVREMVERMTNLNIVEVNVGIRHVRKRGGAL